MYTTRKETVITSILIGLVTFSAHSAELSELAAAYEDLLPDYVNDSDLVLYGKFIAPVDYPLDSLGKPADIWPVEFRPTAVLKGASNNEEKIFVKVRNDILPYLDWNISRKEARTLKEDAFAAVTQRYAEIIEKTESGISNGLLPAEMARDAIQAMDDVLMNQSRGLVPFTNRSTGNAPERLLIMGESYLIFLAEENGGLVLIEEKLGFNLFSGVDALIFMGKITSN